MEEMGVLISYYRIIIKKLIKLGKVQVKIELLELFPFGHLLEFMLN